MERKKQKRNIGKSTWRNLFCILVVVVVVVVAVAISPNQIIVFLILL